MRTATALTAVVGVAPEPRHGSIRVRWLLRLLAVGRLRGRRFVHLSGDRRHRGVERRHSSRSASRRTNQQISRRSLGTMFTRCESRGVLVVGRADVGLPGVPGERQRPRSRSVDRGARDRSPTARSEFGPTSIHLRTATTTLRALRPSRTRRMTATPARIRRRLRSPSAAKRRRSANSWSRRPWMRSMAITPKAICRYARPFYCPIRRRPRNRESTVPVGMIVLPLKAPARTWRPRAIWILSVRATALHIIGAGPGANDYRRRRLGPHLRRVCG